MYQKVLIIIRRSLGDVLAASSLVTILHDNFPQAEIDLLVNDDTVHMARALKHVNKIHCYSYKWREKGWRENIFSEYSLIRLIARRYDLAISLTRNERSNVYAMLAGKTSIGAVDRTLAQSWWKKLLLTHTYVFSPDQHVVLSNIDSIKSLNIPIGKIELSLRYSDAARDRVERLLKRQGIDDFLIFHPSARFEYKIYPRPLRNRLLNRLNSLNLTIVTTGGNSAIDMEISKELPNLSNVHNFIGKTTLEEVIALTDLSLGYVGMDTFNMHIAAALNKKVVAVFGPTLPQMWSPWSNSLQTYAKESKPVQTYGNITLLQADMQCVACGLAGCDDKNGVSECLYEIEPDTIFEEARKLLPADPAPTARG